MLLILFLLLLAAVVLPLILANGSKSAAIKEKSKSNLAALKQSEYVTNITLAVVTTLLFGGVYFALFDFFIPFNIWFEILCAFILSLLHPVAGRFLMLFVLRMVEEFDEVHQTSHLPKLKAVLSVLVAAWPIVLMPLFIFYLIGWLYGGLLKDLGK